MEVETSSPGRAGRDNTRHPRRNSGKCGPHKKSRTWLGGTEPHRRLPPREGSENDVALELSSALTFSECRELEIKDLGDDPAWRSVEASRRLGGVAEWVDEEAIFNMPFLLESMAEGLLITPPAMKKGFDWSHDNIDHYMDFNLWET